MKKLFLIFLLCCVSAFAADVTSLIGEASAGVSVPVAVLKADYDTEGDPTSFFGTNGAALVTGAGVTLTDNGSNSTISGLTGAGSLIAGTFAWISNSAGAGATTDDLYEILSSAATTVTVDNNPLDQTAGILGNDIVDISIGGIFEADTGALLQNAFDLIGPAAGAGGGVIINNLDFLLRASSAITLAATVDVDLISGSTTTTVKTFSTDSSFVYSKGAVTLTTTVTLASGLLNFAAASDYTEWNGFVFDGGDTTADATYCIFNNDSASIFHRFNDCEFKNATNDGVNSWASKDGQWFFANCTFHDCTRDGLGNAGAVGSFHLTGCAFFDNGRHGCFMDDDESTTLKCKFYGNVGAGLKLGSDSSKSIVDGNTFYGNGESGFELVSTSFFPSKWQITNNTSVFNGDYGFDFNTSTSVEATNLFRNNHAFDNDQNAGIAAGGDFCNQTASLAEFEIFASGNNIGGDPLFTSAGTDDFTPTSLSPLIDAGVGGTGDTIGAFCATAGGGGGGGGGDTDSIYGDKQSIYKAN